MPVTKPDELTVATEILLLLHDAVPPPRTTKFAVYVVVAPSQIGDAPVTEPILATFVTVTGCSEDTVPPHPPVIV
jgi:hypothetical protein